MARARRFGSVGILLTALLAAGCLAPRSAPFELPHDSLVTDILEAPQPVVARSQTPEGPRGGLQAPTPPPLPGKTSPLLPPMLPPAYPQGEPVQPVSLQPMAPGRVTIRAHVNGRPIFDDEIMQFVKPAMSYFQGMPEAKRAEKVAEVYNQVLEKIIEDEVMYQDAVKKLEKINPRTLDKLKSVATEEFEKTLKRYRDAGVPEAVLKDRMPTMQKNNERNFIAVEYVRSRVMGPATARVGFVEIKEYYDEHKNEFQTFDSVKWQDIFILVGGQRPTVADAHRYAEDLIAQCRTGDDFVKLVKYDEGTAQFRRKQDNVTDAEAVQGIGERKEDIRPAELADTLFKLKDVGQIEIVDMTNGVHIVRLLKREVAGPIPLNEATQKLIRRKLTDQIIQSEYQRIVRELRQRAVIEYDSGG